MIRTKHKYRNRIAILFSSILLGMGILSGPMATRLQMQSHWAPATTHVDIVYLVCGARAQQRRLQALDAWLTQAAIPSTSIWIGNDTQNSFWSRAHQRNLTRAEWAYKYTQKHFPDYQTTIVPGSFSNTDSEMIALAHALQETDAKNIALVTCGFHARRTLQRFSKHAPESINAKVIPVMQHWENRAPWIVAAEWAKIIRDYLNLTHHPWLSRQKQPES